jgi:glycosyltransferase involved in cell wall biosynthesis
MLADEIVLVVDSHSSDKTESLGKKLGARVIKSHKHGYTPNRNLALKEANGDWVLYLDADERLTPELIGEIKSATEAAKVAWAIPRKNIVLGKELRHGGFGKFDYVKRLFRRDALKKWTGEVHEEPNFEFEGKLTTGDKNSLGHMKNKMLHLKAGTIEEMVDKTNEWSEIEAKLLFDSEHPPMNVFRMFSVILREFWFRMVLKAAYLDGTKGTIHGLYQVFSRAVTYSKLWELQLESQSSKVKNAVKNE